MVREYQRVTDETRRNLLQFIQDGMSIRQAAELVNINYENAKAINRIYRQETRVDKKKGRFRFRPGEDKEAVNRSRLEFQQTISKATPNLLSNNETPGLRNRPGKGRRGARRVRIESAVPTVKAEEATDNKSTKPLSSFKLLVKRKPLAPEPIKYNRNFFKILTTTSARRSKGQLMNEYN